MSRRALVIGAGGAVGEATAAALTSAGWAVTASMHRRNPDAIERLNAHGAKVVFNDIALDDAWSGAAAGMDAVIFTCNLTLAAAALTRAPIQIARLVVFSSNNVAIQPEAPSYRALAEAEAAVGARYNNLAIVRPTMIYGDPRLPTITRVLRMAHAWPIVPAPGNARLQPVFHEDLGSVAAGLAGGDGPGVYAIGGPDIVTMPRLFRMARHAAGGRGIVIPIPSALLNLASLAGLYPAEQAGRADRTRVAAPVTSLPDNFVPKVGLADGLARHWAAMR